MISASITTIAELIQALNNELRRVQDLVHDVRDNPTVRGDLDLQGYRIVNVGRSRGRSDVPTRSELIERGMFEDDAGQHVAHSTIVAPHGVRSKTQARENSDLVPLGQLKKLLSTGGGGNAVLTTDVAQTVEGYKTFRGFAFGTQIRSSLLIGANHNVSINPVTNPGGGFIYVSGPSGDFSITGIRNNLSSPGGTDGQVIVLFNSTTFRMTLVHAEMAAASSSTAANRMYLANNSNAIVGPRGSVMLVYFSSLSRWLNVSRT